MVSLDIRPQKKVRIIDYDFGMRKIRMSLYYVTRTFTSKKQFSISDPYTVIRILKDSNSEIQHQIPWLESANNRMQRHYSITVGGKGVYLIHKAESEA